MSEALRIHHVTITVTDLDASVAWYEQVLGLEKAVVRTGTGWAARYSAARKEHVERRPAPGALVQPRAASVQFGEPQDQREPDAHTR